MYNSAGTKVTSGAEANVVSGSSTAWAPAGALADGTYSYNVYATDGTVNGPTSGRFGFVVDTHAPAAPALTETGGLSADPNTSPVVVCAPEVPSKDRVPAPRPPLGLGAFASCPQQVVPTVVRGSPAVVAVSLTGSVCPPGHEAVAVSVCHEWPAAIEAVSDCALKETELLAPRVFPAASNVAAAKVE